jgi:XTP/dITP diphosphohydrolase
MSQPTHSPSPDGNPDSTLAELRQLIDVVAALRSPQGGCPWDLAQTPETLMPYVIEEAYEVVDAIRQGSPQAIADELGDLLLQVVLQAQIAREAGQFDLATVAQGITAKLIRRHPHVFGYQHMYDNQHGDQHGDRAVVSTEQVKQNWEQIKAEEEQQSTGTQSLLPRLSRYARSLPPLTAGLKISQKAAAEGFEWERVEDVWAKLEEELDEFRRAIAHEPPANQQAELGDVLFTLINLARWHDLDPAEALHDTNRRFIRRLEQMEAVADRPFSTYTPDELETLWQQAKAKLAEQSEELGLS